MVVHVPECGFDPITLISTGAGVIIQYQPTKFYSEDQKIYQISQSGNNVWTGFMQSFPQKNKNEKWYFSIVLSEWDAKKDRQMF